MDEQEGVHIMTTLIVMLKFLHVVSAIVAIAGLFGREVARVHARHSSDIHVVAAFVQVAGRFEQLAIPGSIVVFVVGLLLAWLQGRPLLGFLQGAQSNWLLVSILLYLAIYPLVIFIFIPRGKVFDQALEAAIARGQVTSALAAAFNDPVVRLAHVTEGAIVVAILYLMIAKPF